MVAPASSKEAVTHHVVGKQKKRTTKTTTNRNLPIPIKVEFRSSGPIVSKSDVIRVASVPARVLAIMKFDPSNLRPRRILMRLVAGLVALVVRHATAIAAVRERKKQCPNPSVRHYGASMRP